MMIYRFYKNPGRGIAQLSDNMTLDEIYPLYAITTNKKFYKQFKEQRDMKQFISKKSDMDEDDAKKYLNANSGSILDEYTYFHYPDRDIDNAIEVPVLSTWFEREVVDSDISDISQTLITSDVVFPYIFKEKYLKALKDILFIQFYRISGLFDKHRSYMDEDEMSDLDTYDMEEFEVDELNVFLDLYGDTFK